MRTHLALEKVDGQDYAPGLSLYVELHNVQARKEVYKETPSDWACHTTHPAGRAADHFSSAAALVAQPPLQLLWVLQVLYIRLRHAMILLSPLVVVIGVYCKEKYSVLRIRN